MSEISETERTLAVVGAFLDAVARRDVAAILAQMSADAVYENFGEDVDAGRHEGHDAVGSVFAAVFAAYPDCRSDADELFPSGDKCCSYWTMRWTEPNGSESSSRGTDVFTLRAGKVADKKTYE